MTLAGTGFDFAAAVSSTGSLTCPICGHVSSANRKSQAQFMCVECGYSEHADLVGAINVLRAGHARIACEVSSDVMLPAAGTNLGGQTGSTPVMAVWESPAFMPGEDVKLTMTVD